MSARRFVLALTLIILVSACAGGTDKERTAPVKVGAEPVEAAFLEQDSANIAYWHGHGAKDRILVRLSASDGLEPVDDAALAGIRELAEKGDTAAMTGAGDALAGDRLFGPSSVAYVAHRLGMIRELIWVVPTFQSVDAQYLEDIKKTMAGLYPESAADIRAITLEGVIASGSVNGVPVRMIGLQDLRDPGEPVLLDIDASFFGALYADENKTRSLQFVAGMFKLLGDAGISSDMVSIAASGEDGSAALRFRSFARYLSAMLKEPEMLDAKPPELWSERQEAWMAEQKNPETAVPVLKDIVARYPDDAASRYDLADLYFRLGDMKACAAELSAAARMDPGYNAAFRIYGDMLAGEGRKEDAALFTAARP